MSGMGWMNEWTDGRSLVGFINYFVITLLLLCDAKRRLRENPIEMVRNKSNNESPLQMHHAPFQEVSNEGDLRQ